MIENGVMYFPWQDTDGSIYFNFVYPINFDGNEYYARLVVKQDQNGNRFYDNEFSDVIKKDALPNGPEPGSIPGNLTHLSSKNILQNILTVNENDVSKVLDENGEPLVLYHLPFSEGRLVTLLFYSVTISFAPTSFSCKSGLS